jgi:Acetyltransferase (GNAT) family
MTALNVLKTSPLSSPDQLVRLFHQSQLEWARHLGEESELDFGRWILDCLFEAYLVPGISPEDVISQMAAKDWHCCTLNPSVPAEQTVPLAKALLTQGWMFRSQTILYRQRPVSPILKDIPGIKVIPARASFRHYRELMEQSTPDFADAAMLHLDDSHFDALLALKDGNPVGSIGVLTSGEVGTLREWHVIASQRHLGIGRLLLDRALEICARGVLRHVMIGLPKSADVATQLCQASGFATIGQWTTFQKDSCKFAGLFA